MSLLFDSDYEYLKEVGQEYVEDEASRFLILKRFPLPNGVFKVGEIPSTSVDVLYIIPPNYNTEGGDMFWLNCRLERVDGKPIPNISGPGEDSRTHDGVEYLRWSRHWHNKPWRPKNDNIEQIISRLTWAFANPDAKRT
ncbi:E2/UBC family protein [Herbaspirillum sp. ST 5-3]|uniref:E2/UBC family protein n=1 Tax=Oxalobacteraceae TaxID=75682 RepID=UPI0010A42DEB|nr:E2/UBC family protein [Herbaspirillum sp. ST 5-3]